MNFPLLFVEECLHCHQEASQLFCRRCQEEVAFLFPKVADPDRHQKTTLFSSLSPLYSLYQAMERGNLHYYLSGFVSLCYWQLLHLEWPIRKISYVSAKGWFSLSTLLLRDIRRCLMKKDSAYQKSEPMLQKRVRGKAACNNALMICRDQKASKKILERPNTYILQLFDLGEMDQEAAFLP